MIHEFVWTDLSTYHLKESAQFYSELFNWNIVDSGEYLVAHIGAIESVGIYQTPDFFKKIGMPHFWMNYIQVDDLKTIVQKAVTLNGKVEIESIAFNNGYIALIRDPMGAGFTVYQGAQLFQSSEVKHGNVINRELHTSNIQVQIEFYSKLFGWDFIPIKEHVYSILCPAKNEIAKALEISNDFKGKYEYWVTIFYVDDLSKSFEDVIRLGGIEVSRDPRRILMTDRFREAFFYIQSGKGDR